MSETIEAEPGGAPPRHDAPSGYRIETALAAWQSARARLLQEDPSLEHDEAALVDLLGPEEGDVDSILARLLRGAVHAESMADAGSERIGALQERVRRYLNRAQSMRSTAFAVLDSIGKSKVELEDLTASITRGRVLAVITDPDAVPDIYVEVVTTRKIDKATIQKVIKSGGKIPGVERSNGLPSLTIRTR